MKNLWLITGESVFLQAHFLVPETSALSSQTYFLFYHVQSLCLSAVSNSAVCLSACLPVCPSAWLAGWLSDCPQCCLSVWQVWQLFCRFSLRLIHYNVLLSQHILSDASHRNRTIWCKFIRQRSSILAISRWRWCSSHPLTAKGQCTEYNAYARYFNMLPVFVINMFFPFLYSIFLISWC